MSIETKDTLSNQKDDLEGQKRTEINTSLTSVIKYAAKVKTVNICLYGLSIAFWIFAALLNFQLINFGAFILLFILCMIVGTGLIIYTKLYERRIMKEIDEDCKKPS